MLGRFAAFASWLTGWRGKPYGAASDVCCQPGLDQRSIHWADAPHSHHTPDGKPRQIWQKNSEYVEREVLGCPVNGTHSVEPRSCEVGIVQSRVSDVSVAQIGIRQARATQDRAAQIGIVQVCALKVSAAEIYARQVGP